MFRDVPGCSGMFNVPGFIGCPRNFRNFRSNGKRPFTFKFPELIMRVNPKLCVKLELHGRSVSLIGWSTVCVGRADLGRKFQSYKTKII